MTLNHKPNHYENTTCLKTGKTGFPSQRVAMEQIQKFKAFNRMKINGRRIKHRVGKPEQTRAYQCPSCSQWHLTSMKESEYKNNLDPLGKPVRIRINHVNEFKKYLSAA
jgi:hypothetical protein